MIKPLPLKSDYNSASGSSRSRSFTVERAAICSLIAFRERAHPADIVETLYPHDRDVIELVTRATTTVTDQSTVSQFSRTALVNWIDNLPAPSAGFAVAQRCQRFEFGGNAKLRVPALAVSAANATFLGEGTPLPVFGYTIANIELQPFKLGSIAVFSNEVMEMSRPNLEAVLRDAMGNAEAMSFDTAYFSTSAATSTTPAGLRYNIAAATASTATDRASAMLADVETLTGSVAAIAGTAPILLVAEPKRANALKMAPRQLPFEIFSSSALSAGVVIALATNAVVGAMDPVPRFEVSDQASVVMNDVGTAFSTAGSPNVVGAPIRSLYQSDCSALKLILECDWALRNSSGCAWVTATNW
jgi:hypothetical protein